MSNYLAIATVTETLRRLLDATLKAELNPGAAATAVRPRDAPGGGASPLPALGVNVFLYQVNPNGAWRNADLPTRREDATLLQRPRAAFDLSYILTFYGDEAKLEPQRAAGSTLRCLHARPVLTRKMVEEAVRLTDFLSGSNLAEEVELVKLSPIPLPLEEVSKLWSVFFQTAYALSIAYQAAVVFVEGKDVDTTRFFLAVSPLGSGEEKFTYSGSVEEIADAQREKGRNVYAIPFRPPVIAQAQSAEGGSTPIVVGGTPALKGRNLRGEVTRVKIFGQEFSPFPQDVDDTEIRLALKDPPVSEEALRAGVQSVQVVHRLMMGTPPVEHRGLESNVAAFVLHPIIAKKQDGTYDVEYRPAQAGEAATIRVTLKPVMGQKQEAVLVLNEVGTATAYVLDAPARDGDKEQIEFPIPGVKSGSYWVRVQVDGAESLLEADAQGHYIAPKAVLP